MEKQLISVKAAASILSISKFTLYSWTITGRFPSVKLNGRRMIRVRDLEKIIEDNQCDGKPNIR